jgi:hypothetical protein
MTVGFIVVTFMVGSFVVGSGVVGCSVGLFVGELVGDSVGLFVGGFVGVEGAEGADGAGVGVALGHCCVLCVKPPPPDSHDVHPSKHAWSQMMPSVAAVAVVLSTQYVPDFIRFGLSVSTNVGCRQLLVA